MDKEKNALMEELQTKKFPKEAAPAGKNIRCLCNRLICKSGEGVIEIKCPKCKRIVKIHVGKIGDIEYL